MSGPNGTAWRPLYETGYPPVEAPGDDFLGWMHAECDPASYGVTTSGETTDAVLGTVRVALPPNANAHLDAALDHALTGQGAATGTDGARTYRVDHPEVRSQAASRAAQVVRAWLAWQKFPTDPALHFYFDQFTKAVPGLQDEPAAKHTVGTTYQPEDADPTFCASLEAAVAEAAQAGKPYYVWEDPHGLLGVVRHALRPADPNQPFVYVTPEGDLHVYAHHPERFAQALMREDATPVAPSAICEALTEAKATVAPDDPNRPLAKQYVQFVYHNDVYRPAGPGVFTETLGRSAYRIVDTMAGIEFHRVRPKTDELYHFPSSVMEGVLAEIDRFWTLNDDYAKLGALHHRGILLEGPPGTGKTSLIHQVCEMMVARGDPVFYARRIGALIEALNAFRQVEATRPVVVVLEDADEHIKYSQNDFLQLLDGDQAVDHVLYLATTNYLESFPPRLRRPGRFDHIVHVGPPPIEGRQVFLQHKLGKFEKAAEITRLAKVTEGFSFGHLRELVLAVYALKEPVAEVVERLRTQMGTPMVAERPMGESVTEAGPPKGSKTTKALTGFTTERLSGKRTPIEIPAGTPVLGASVDLRDVIAGEPVTWLKVTRGGKTQTVGVLNLPVLKRDWWKDYFAEGVTFTATLPVDEVSPPGFSGTVKAMKKHGDIANPYALAWAMYKKGAKPHKPVEKGKPGYVTPRTHASRQARKAAAKKRPLAASHDTVSDLAEGPLIHGMDDKAWKQATPARRVRWLQNQIAFLRDRPNRTGKPLDPLQQGWLRRYEERLAKIQAKTSATESLTEATPQWVTDALATIGGRRGMFMLGVKQSTYDEATKRVILQIGRNASGANFLTIQYDVGTDLYNLALDYRTRSAEQTVPKVKAATQGVDAEAVGPWIEAKTGMRLSLGTLGRTEGTDDAADLTVASAEAFGRRAFAAGTPATPAKDAAFQAVWKAHASKATGAARAREYSQLLTAWAKGWHAANMAAPVSESVRVQYHDFDPTTLEPRRVRVTVTEAAGAMDAVLDTLAREFPQCTRETLAEFLAMHARGLTARNRWFRAVVERATALRWPVPLPVAEALTVPVPSISPQLKAHVFKLRATAEKRAQATGTPHYVVIRHTGDEVSVMDPDEFLADQRTPQPGRVVYVATPAATEAAADRQTIRKTGAQDYTAYVGRQAIAAAMSLAALKDKLRAKGHDPAQFKQERFTIATTFPQEAATEAVLGTYRQASGIPGSPVKMDVLGIRPLPAAIAKRGPHTRGMLQVQIKDRVIGLHWINVRPDDLDLKPGVEMPAPQEAVDEAFDPAASPGKTRSGKVIPAFADPAYTQGYKFPKITGEISPVRSVGFYREAAKALRRNLPDWTAQDHADAATAHALAGNRADREWGTVRDAEHQRVFKKSAEFTDYKISGIGRDEYSPKVKDRLRALAHGASQHHGLHGAHDLAAKVRGGLAPKKESLDESATGDAACARLDDDTTAAAYMIGVVQKGVVQALDGQSAPTTLPALAQHEALRDVHFTQLLPAVEALVRKGLVARTAGTGPACYTLRAPTPATESLLPRWYVAGASLPMPTGADLDAPVAEDRAKPLKGLLPRTVWGRVNVSDKGIVDGKHQIQLVGGVATAMGKPSYTLVTLEDLSMREMEQLAKALGVGESLTEAMFAVGAWQHPGAQDYADRCMAAFGEPNAQSAEAVTWHDEAGFDEITVRDEFIPHDFPQPHHDFVYASRALIVPAHLTDEFAAVSGSILIDGLKGTVTARCGSLLANAITLGFVADVVAGAVKPTKAEYAKRILGGFDPPWFTDALREKPGHADAERPPGMDYGTSEFPGAEVGITPPGAYEVTEADAEWNIVWTSVAGKKPWRIVSAKTNDYLREKREEPKVPGGTPLWRAYEFASSADAEKFLASSAGKKALAQYKADAKAAAESITEAIKGREKSVTLQVTVPGVKGVVNATYPVGAFSSPTDAERSLRTALEAADLGGRKARVGSAVYGPGDQEPEAGQAPEMAWDFYLSPTPPPSEGVDEAIKHKAKSVTLTVTLAGAPGPVQATYPVGTFDSPQAAEASLRNDWNFVVQKARVVSAQYQPTAPLKVSGLTIPSKIMPNEWNFFGMVRTREKPPAEPTEALEVLAVDEGRTTTPKYVVELFTAAGGALTLGAMPWNVKTDGAPNAKNLADFAAGISRQPGLPTVVRGHIRLNRGPDSDVVATWGAKAEGTTPTEAQAHLKTAIDQHQMHLDDPKTATPASQKAMMGHMQQARTALAAGQVDERGIAKTHKYEVELFTAAGRSVTPDPMLWNVRTAGQPTAANLAKWAQDFNQIPGASKAVRGHIRQDRPGGEIVATWGTQAEGSTKGPYPFAEKEAYYRRKTMAQLLYAKTDAAKSRDNMRGHDPAAENWYADDVHTILKEIARRKAGGTQEPEETTERAQPTPDVSKYAPNPAKYKAAIDAAQAAVDADPGNPIKRQDLARAKQKAAAAALLHGAVKPKTEGDDRVSEAAGVASTTTFRA